MALPRGAMGCLRFVMVVFLDFSHLLFLVYDFLQRSKTFVKSFLDLPNLTEWHLILLLKFYGVLYTPTPIFEYIIKSAIAVIEVLPLNPY